MKKPILRKKSVPNSPPVWKLRPPSFLTVYVLPSGISVTGLPVHINKEGWVLRYPAIIDYVKNKTTIETTGWLATRGDVTLTKSGVIAHYLTDDRELMNLYMNFVLEETGRN